MVGSWNTAMWCAGSFGRADLLHIAPIQPVTKRHGLAIRSIESLIEFSPTVNGSWAAGQDGA
jgi:hypothetical protein